MDIKNISETTVIATATSGCFLRLKGTRGNPRVKKVRMRAETVNQWEEVPLTEAENADNETRYNERVDSLIRTRYSVSAELALLRQRDTKPEEFAEYYAFAERCKVTARAELNALTEVQA